MKIIKNLKIHTNRGTKAENLRYYNINYRIILHKNV